ncbi:hypothetical protein LIT25_12140 [Bacillus sp. F19]|nr:hypothetical protein LIT25_12140 [Bacillus sp. F19]
MKKRLFTSLAICLSTALVTTSVQASDQVPDKSIHSIAQQKVADTNFKVTESGEALLDITALALGVDWGKKGKESAVVTVKVDGNYVQDVVLFMGQEKFTYEVSLGHVSAGKHKVEVFLNDEKSPDGVKKVIITKINVKTIPLTTEDALIYKYSPILYGRNLSEIPGNYENNATDIPLLMYHKKSKDNVGNITIEYSMIWSNEDGGTNTPALMARWGRTTDIEWVYRVTLNPNGVILSEKYQGLNHATVPFTGVKEGHHPLLVTSTANNMVSQLDDPAVSTGYRFFLNPAQTLPENRTREVLMDANPWIYEIMAKEMNREEKVEKVADPNTPEISDQKNYLFIELNQQRKNSSAGTAISVKLKNDETLYTSNHDIPDWSINRNGPAATTVELPAGTDVNDIEVIKAVSVPINNSLDYNIKLTNINRAFFLDKTYQPQSSFFQWDGEKTLTPEKPECILWNSN